MQGESYFMLFIDDHTRMNWVNFLKEKIESFVKFKKFKTLLENEPNIKIKCLSSNNGGDFTINEFSHFWETHIIKRYFLTPKPLNKME